VSDTLNHRIQVFDLDGTLLREISEYGGAAGEFYVEQWKIDEQGRVFPGGFRK